jgi:hypothetical protein
MSRGAAVGFVSASIQELVDRAVQGTLEIPEFQRGFVWQPDQVSALADSLYRDYPIGQILLWDNPNPPPAGMAGAAARRWLVDGQQRVTALCLLFGRKPDWCGPEEWERRLAAVNVLANVGLETEGVEFGLANPVRSADPRWISVRELLSIDASELVGPEPLAARAAAIQSKFPAASAKKVPASAVSDRLRRLWQIRAQQLPVVDVRHPLEDVAEIFTRLNMQGTDILEADVSLALASTRHPGWVREEFLPFARNLADSGYELEPSVILRSLAAIGEGKAGLQELSREFWSRPDLLAIWGQTKGAISAVVGSLMNAGALSSTVLPSHNALIPLTLLHARFASEGFQFPRALHWFLLATRDGRYSGASTSTLQEDLVAIREASTFPEALESLRAELEVDVRVAPEEFLARAAWNRPLQLVLYLTLVDRKATDWRSRQRIAHARGEDTVDAGFVPIWHRFFPAARSVLRSPEHDYTEDEVGALANLIVLNAKPTERSWSTQPPSQYVDASSVYRSDIESQLVPLQRTLWDPGRYRDFLAERSKLLARAANAYLASLLGAPTGPAP